MIRAGIENKCINIHFIDLATPSPRHWPHKIQRSYEIILYCGRIIFHIFSNTTNAYPTCIIYTNTHTTLRYIYISKDRMESDRRSNKHLTSWIYELFLWLYWIWWTHADRALIFIVLVYTIIVYRRTRAVCGMFKKYYFCG